MSGPPPDHQQAIQAASRALTDGEEEVWSPDDAARIAVEAAWPVALEQLQAAQHENQQLRDHNTALTEWIKTKLASPHQDRHDGHRNGFCRRCADLYVEGMAALEQHAALGQVDQP